MQEKIRKDILRLADSRIVVVGSVDENGYPNGKGMFNAKHDGIRTFWLSTNTSSIRVEQFQQNPKAFLYFVDMLRISGVMFTGQMKVHLDDETRLMLWKKGDEQYYPLGPTDPDYAVLEFTAEQGNYYHGLNKEIFSVDEV